MWVVVYRDRILVSYPCLQIRIWYFHLEMTWMWNDSAGEVQKFLPWDLVLMQKQPRFTTGLLVVTQAMMGLWCWYGWFLSSCSYISFVGKHHLKIKINVWNDIHHWGQYLWEMVFLFWFGNNSWMLRWCSHRPLYRQINTDSCVIARCWSIEPLLLWTSLLMTVKAACLSAARCHQVYWFNPLGPTAAR
jgi:hypothetical protein